MSSRERVGAWIESDRMQRFIVTLILVNAVTLGLETSESLMARHGELLHALDRLILAVFVVEILIKLYAKGLDSSAAPGTSSISSWWASRLSLRAVRWRCCAPCGFCGCCVSSRWFRGCALWWKHCSRPCRAFLPSGF